MYGVFALKPSLVALRAAGIALDELDVAMCAFDMRDCAVLWNEQFLAYFPEHAGHIHVGEHYAENLRRFYRSRLSEDEHALLDVYVDEGLQRHRSQTRAFEFEHRGHRLRVSSTEVGRICRLRVWRRVDQRPALADVEPWPLAVPAEAREALESIADGALVVDDRARVLWANTPFLQIYRLSAEQDLRGLTFSEIYASTWGGEEDSSPYNAALALLDERQRFAGAPYELPLPGDRWVRVIERRSAAGSGHGYCSHVDITALKRQQHELARAQEQLAEMAVTDGLTGLRNRSWFDARLESEWRRSGRVHAVLSLLLIDVDHFKRLNDEHGHLAGDEVLRQLAKVLAQHARRGSDGVCRYGGEEFAMLLPNTDSATASALAEQLRGSVSRLQTSLPRSLELHITVSIGVGTAEGACFQLPPASLVECADVALYRAKRAGRNRVVSGLAATTHPKD